MIRHLPQAVITAVMSIAVAGCVGAPTTGAEPSSATPSPSTSPPPVVDVHEDWTWTVVRTGIPQNVRAVAAYDGRYLATNVDGDADVLRVTDVRTGRVVATHERTTPGPGWHLTNVYLADPWLMVVEEPYDGEHRSKPAIHAFRYDLRTGDGVDLWEEPLPRSASPEPTIANGRSFVYTTRHQGRYCLVLLDIASLHPADGPCAPPGHAIGFPSLGGGHLGAVVGTLPDVTPYCRYGITASPDDLTVAHRVPQRRPCDGYGTVAMPWGTVWHEVPAGSATIGYSRVWATTDDDALVRLGQGDTRTAVACGSWVYWVDEPNGHQTVVRRWRPGQPIQRVYRSPSPGWSVTSALSCDGGWLRLFRYWTGGGPERGTQIVVAHPPDAPGAPGPDDAQGDPIGQIMATAPTAAELQAANLPTKLLDLTRCADLGGVRYCLLLGFTSQDPWTPSWRSWVVSKADQPPSDTGALTLREEVLERAAMTDDERLRLERQEIRTAVAAVAKGRETQP